MNFNIENDFAATFQPISDGDKLELDIEFDELSKMKLQDLLNKSHPSKENQLIHIKRLEIDLNYFNQLEPRKRYSGVFKGITYNIDSSMFVFIFKIENFDLEYKYSSVINYGEYIEISNLTMRVFAIGNISYSIIE